MSYFQTIFVDENELQPYPEKDVSDYMRSPIDAAASRVIPFGDKILASVLGNSLSKRRDEWLKTLAEKVQELLRKKNLTVEDLQNNDKFIDAVFQATQIALRTSQKEKIEALKNAIVNVAIDDYWDDSLVPMYLNLIDQLTPIQINMLSFFDVNSWEELDEKTNGHRNSMGTSNYNAVEFFVTYHNLNTVTEKANLFWKNLESFGLVSSSSSGPWATDVGKDFLRFISEVEV
jgi:hypothetical protein